MALKATIDRQSILEQNNVLATYQYKPVCSIHNITYWLIIVQYITDISCKIK
jgi:hypothetical protein